MSELGLTKHGGSLVGKTVVVNQFDGRDFDTVYASQGLSSREAFVISADNEGKTLDDSGIRIVSFKNDKGITASGNASRFDLAQ